MSFERTQIVIPSSFFTGTQPISIAVTSAAISSSGATHTKYGDSTSFETHDGVTFHVLFSMFLSSQITCFGQSLAKAGLRGSIKVGLGVTDVSCRSHCGRGLLVQRGRLCADFVAKVVGWVANLSALFRAAFPQTSPPSGVRDKGKELAGNLLFSEKPPRWAFRFKQYGLKDIFARDGGVA
jgi:hypothetical protein